MEPNFAKVGPSQRVGAGMGCFSYRNLKFLGFPKGNWTELHNEPLDLLFSMGSIGVILVGFWINSMKKYFTWNTYSKCAVVIGVIRCRIE